MSNAKIHQLTRITQGIITIKDDVITIRIETPLSISPDLIGKKVMSQTIENIPDQKTQVHIFSLEN